MTAASGRVKRGERGISAIAIMAAIGAVVMAIGIVVLVNTDSQVRESFLGQKLRDSDWTVRSAITLTEDAWRRFVGVAPAPPPIQFTGTLLNAVSVLSRESALLWALNEGDENLSLLPFAYDWMVQTDNQDLDVRFEVPHPDRYMYQVDLRPEGFSTDTDGDGIVLYDPQTQPPIWNNIDDRGNRQFNAVITVLPNGVPYRSLNNAMYVFPVRFELTLSTRNAGLQNEREINRTVTGLGSCSLYLFRRSFAEYVMFANIFTTESGGDIQLPSDFTYGGPVHTNTHFYFTGNPSTRFLDVVTQAEKKAAFGSATNLLDADQTATVKPQFEKGFYRGVPKIDPPTQDDLGDVKRGVLAGRAEPSAPGVYLPVSASGSSLDLGGIYIKGDVASLKMSQGNRRQTYDIVQNLASPVREPISTTTTYYNSSNCTGTAYTTLTSERRSMRVVEVARVTVGHKYSITCDYNGNTTLWVKKALVQTETVTTMSSRTSSTRPWSVFSGPTTTVDNPVEEIVESRSYAGVVDVIQDEGDDQRPPQENRKQPAIYIDGDLGVLATYSKYDSAGYPTGTRKTPPSGLSGTLDRDTELLIYATGHVVITDDVLYENHNNAKNDPAMNILGLISERSKVYINYEQPFGRDVNIDASIMAISDHKTDKSKRGVLTAYDYKINLGSPKPTINLYGGVVQAYYGAVGQSSGTGYNRTFMYDPRLKTSPPPLYPKQAACIMQTINDRNQETLQLVWTYDNKAGH